MHESLCDPFAFRSSLGRALRVVSPLALVLSWGVSGCAWNWEQFEEGSPLTSDRMCIVSGESAELRWQIAGADTCEASGSWSGTRSPAATETIVPSEPRSEFVLRCTGARSETVRTTIFVEPETLPAGVVQVPYRTINVGDGEASDWAGVPRRRVSDLYEDPSRMGCGVAMWRPADRDFEADVSLAWDEVFLYVLVNVGDDNVLVSADCTTGTQPYNRDRVEILVDGGNDGPAPGPSFGDDDHQVSVDAGGCLDDFGSTPTPDEFLYRVTIGEGGYAFEGALSWAFLRQGAGDEPLPGARYRFNLAVVDNDGGDARQHVLMWSCADEYWTDTSEFPEIVLTCGAS